MLYIYVVLNVYFVFNLQINEFRFELTKMFSDVFFFLVSNIQWFWSGIIMLGKYFIVKTFIQ